RRGTTHRRLGLPRCPGPENQLEVVALDADGQKPRPVRQRVLSPLFHAEDVRVEVERLVLVADHHARVEDLLEHCCASGGRGHCAPDNGRAATVTAAAQVNGAKLNAQVKCENPPKASELVLPVRPTPSPDWSGLGVESHCTPVSRYCGFCWLHPT